MSGLSQHVLRVNMELEENCMMSRVCMGLVRFCLCAWLGIATFFVVLVIELRQSELFAEGAKFNHPRVLFPLYYGFEFALLGVALLGAAAYAWSARPARRRLALLAAIVAAVLLAACDYGLIYRTLLGLMDAAAAGASEIPQLPARFHELHRSSRWINEVILVLTAAGAVLALFPEQCSHHAPRDEPPALVSTGRTKS